MSIASVFLILFSLFLARFLTAYDPKQLIKGYLEIPNETAAKLLISQSNPRYGRYKNKKEYRNKMSYLGLSLYIIWFVFIIFFIVLSFSKPIKAMDYTIETKTMYFHAKNLNEAIIICTFILLAINVIAVFLNMTFIAVRSPKDQSRTLTIILGIFFIIFFLFFIGLEIDELFQLIRS